MTKFEREFHAFLVFIGVWLAIMAVCFSALAQPSTIGWLQSLPQPWVERDDDPAVRTAHLGAVADAIDRVTVDTFERALLASVGWHESRFEVVTCTGNQTGDQGRAWGCWQSWDADRSGGIEGQAKRAIEHLRKGYHHCGQNWNGAVSIYATGKTCDWPGARKRVEMAKRMARGE